MQKTLRLQEKKEPLESKQIKELKPELNDKPVLCIM